MKEQQFGTYYYKVLAWHVAGWHVPLLVLSLLRGRAGRRSATAKYNGSGLPHLPVRVILLVCGVLTPLPIGSRHQSRPGLGHLSVAVSCVWFGVTCFTASCLQRGSGGDEIPGGRERERLYLTQHCHRLNDSCVKMGRGNIESVYCFVNCEGQRHKAVSIHHNL